MKTSKKTKESKSLEWGIKVDKTNATKHFVLRETYSLNDLFGNNESCIGYKQNNIKSETKTKSEN